MNTGLITRNKPAHRAAAVYPRQKGLIMAKQYTRRGIFFNEDGTSRMMICVVGGKMADGSKVWQEINPKTREIIDDQEYLLFTRGGWSEFCYL